MKTTGKALQDSDFKIKTVDDSPLSPGYFSLELPNGYEICIEPLLFDNAYLAIYKDGDTVTEKIPFKILKKAGDDGENS